jgi:hypothetical protein
MRRQHGGRKLPLRRQRLGAQKGDEPSAPGRSSRT